MLIVNSSMEFPKTGQKAKSSVPPQLDSREDNKMWLVRHLELIRQITLKDLRIAKSLCQPAFPPHYNILEHFLELYHEALSNRVSIKPMLTKTICLSKDCCSYGFLTVFGAIQIILDMITSFRLSSCTSAD